MTANTLSNSDRAKVASAVTGKVWIVFHEIYITHLGDWWSPSLSDGADDRQRSQALALVEWLADNGTRAYPNGNLLFDRFLKAIQQRDTAALEYMAHQMITKGKQDE